MKKLLFVAAALSLVVGVASAAPPTAEQKAEFYKTCYGISQNETLCTCKADAAMTLIDTDFMAVVIASMRGKSLADQYYDTYNNYIAHSNQICKPDY